MDTKSPESRNRLQQTIIDEIYSLEASARALRCRYNEFSPISRLPFEVLAAIFSYLSVFAWNKGSRIFAWIYVAHICRRWRGIALNHPCFWSRINLTKLTPIGMAEILSRAKMAPLHLEGDSEGWNTRHVELVGMQLKAHLSHTRHLEFTGIENDLRIVISKLVSPTPTLESLSLSYMDPDSPYNYSR
jgi:hypothetical protein